VAKTRRQAENRVWDIILDEVDIKKYQKQFSNNLRIIVLLPKKTVTIKRDKQRKCWSAGEKCIDWLYHRFILLKPIWGADCFIDNSNETPTQTIEKHFGWLSL
jgi:hypothetical protein